MKTHIILVLIVGIVVSSAFPYGGQFGRGGDFDSDMFSNYAMMSLFGGRRYGNPFNFGRMSRRRRRRPRYGRRGRRGQRRYGRRGYGMGMDMDGFGFDGLFEQPDYSERYQNGYNDRNQQDYGDNNQGDNQDY